MVVGLKTYPQGGFGVCTLRKKLEINGKAGKCFLNAIWQGNFVFWESSQWNFREERVKFAGYQLLFTTMQVGRADSPFCAVQAKLMWGVYTTASYWGVSNKGELHGKQMKMENKISSNGLSLTSGSHDPLWWWFVRRLYYFFIAKYNSTASLFG